ARQSDRDSAVEVAAGNCAIQLYTSGTTGHPKGAQLSHANLLTLLPGALRQFGNWHEKDVNLVCMPLFHIGGSGWGLIGFYRGVESVLMRDADPAAILRLIPEFRITKVFVVPASSCSCCSRRNAARLTFPRSNSSSTERPRRPSTWCATRSRCSGAASRRSMG